MHVPLSVAFPQATPASIFPPPGVILLSEKHAKCDSLIQVWLWSEFLAEIISLLFIQHAASDYYKLDDLLTHEEKNLRNKIRELVVEEVAPIMTEVNIHINTYMQHSLTNLPLQVKKINIR